MRGGPAPKADNRTAPSVPPRPSDGCPRCGGSRWTGHDRRPRRLVEFEGLRVICQQRWRCLGCHKVVTAFDDRVVPRHLYALAVIVDGLTRRQTGETWERAAATCTSDGQLDPSTLKRWHRRFQLDDGGLIGIPPPAAHFSRPPADAILGAPAGSRSPKPSQEDPWARSPPQP